MSAYYNEIEPFAARWLRNLVAAGLIAPGDVDERSIVEVSPDDLRGYAQCHFFAGIGGWSYALRLAGWPDDRPAWTGSCPCQPLSGAGQRKGHADERHLWPAFHRLIAECRPATVLGEQVAGADGREWLAGIRADLEAAGYACGAADLCAAGVGAPHIRQRLFWVADAATQRLPAGAREPGRGHGAGQSERPGVPGRLAHAAGAGPQGRDGPGQRADAQREAAERDGAARGMADAAGGGLHEQPGDRREPQGAWKQRVGEPDDRGRVGDAGPHHCFWRDADRLLCRDGRWRPVGPGAFPLAHGVPSRVGRLLAYGNAIVPQVAAEFVAAFMECAP